MGEEIRLLSRDKLELEYRQKSTKKNLILGSVLILMQENQMTENWMESFPSTVRLLIVTLLKEVQTVVTDIHHFDNWDESLLATFFWNFWTIRIFFQELSAVLLERSELQCKGIPKLIAFFGIPSIWGSQKDLFQWKYFRSSIAFFDPGEPRLMKKTYARKLGQKFKFLHFLLNILTKF